MWSAIVPFRRILSIFLFASAAAVFLIGAAFVCQQSYLFLRDGTWYRLSLLEVITYDVDPTLAEAIGLPRLSAWHEAYDELEEGLAADSESLATLGQERGLPELSRWQMWLKYPKSWMGLKTVVTTLADTPGLGFIGLLAGSLLGLLGLRFRPAPPIEATEPASYE